MSRQIRDYSAETIREFIEYMDEYYDSQNGKINSFWDRIAHYLGFYSIGDADGNAKKYIKSLTELRSETEGRIETTWLAVGRVEEEYDAKIQSVNEMCEAYSSMVEKIIGMVNITTFSKPDSFGTLLAKCASEYTKLIETKLEEIINKPVDELTDADIEMLAYSALTTTDEELKERIYNLFYKETSDEHITYTNGTPEEEYFHYYDRDEEQWEKFLTCESYYYSLAYNDYLAGEKSDAEINVIIRNNMALQYLDKNGQTLFVGKEGNPITVSNTGEISVTIPTDDNVIIWNTYENSEFDRSNSAFDEQRYQNELQIIPLKQGTFDPNVRILNGQEAADAISADIADEVYEEYSFDWDTAGYKIISKTADHFIPGSGELLDAAKKYIYDPVEKSYEFIKDTAENIEKGSPDYITIREKEAYEWFVESFDLKCVSTEHGYTLMLSQDTTKKVNAMLEWMKENHQDIYKELVPNACLENGKTDAEWFIENADPVVFRSYLAETGILKEMDDANII